MLEQKKKMKLFLISIFLLFLISSSLSSLNMKEKKWLSLSSKEYKNGWLHIKVKGEPYERGKLEFLSSY